MKRLLSVILVSLLVISVCIVCASAATAPAAYIGDINADGKVDISDATVVQRVVAGLEENTDYKRCVGDATKNGALTIVDATQIQRWVAEIDVIYSANWYNYDMFDHDYYVDYDSGIAMAGVPVTFTMDARAGSPILRYDLYVDDVCVVTSETDNSLTYTFEKAGEYDVRIETVALFATGVRDFEKYVVVEPYQSKDLQFKNLYSTGKYWGVYAYDREGMQIHAEGIGGTAPYQYDFELTTYINGKLSFENCIYQGYSEYNTFNLPVFSDYGWRDTVKCELEVSIRDADFNVVTRTMDIYYQMQPIG